jgi:O-antigen ligase
VTVLLQAGLLLLIASIPFEYPERTIPLEIPTLTGAIFLLLTLFHPRRCYGHLPAAVLWFGVYLTVYLGAMLLGGEHAGEAFAEFIVVLQGVLVLLAAANMMVDEPTATRALVTFIAACSVRASLPFLGFARTSNAVWTGGERVSALGQNANSAAMILAAGMVALIGVAYGRPRKTLGGLLVAAALGVLLGFAVLETGSRGGLLALVGGVLVFALAADSLRARFRNGLIALIALSILITGALHLPLMKNRWEDSVRNGNLAGREQLYPALWTMFQEKPVLGWGPVANTYELASRIGERDRPSRAAHNIILELLTASGIAGAIPFLLGGWICARHAWRARRGPHGVLPLALFCSVLISNMSGDWIASKLIWVTLAYTLASREWNVAVLPVPAEPVPIRSAAPLWPLGAAASPRGGL